MKALPEKFQETARSILWGLVAFSIVLGLAFVNYQQGSLSKTAKTPTTVDAPPAEKVKKKIKKLPIPPPECKPRKQKCVYLTFDDGPWPGTTNFLKVLKKEKVPATFFVVGKNLKAFPKESKALKISGQTVGVHTWSHEQLPRLSNDAIKHTLSRTKREIKIVLDRDVNCYRPPYGATEKRVRHIGRELGLKEHKWTVDPQDWRGKSSSVIVHAVLSEVQPNSIILLHDGGGDRTSTLRATEMLIKKLKKRGYGFRSLCSRD